MSFISSWFKKKKVCPTCNGSGTEVFYKEVHNGLWDVEPLKLYNICAECDGKGKIVVEELK